MATFRGTLQPDDAQWGSSRNDTFIGSRTSDKFSGWIGDDLAEGKRGDDFLYGEEGVDLLFGGRGNDDLDAGSDYGDRMEGGTGNDSLHATMFNSAYTVEGSWQDMIGGRGADVFDISIWESENLTQHPDAHAWADIRDFRASDGDKLKLQLDLYPEDSLDSRATLEHFDSNADGRLTDTDDAVIWDGRALQLVTETASIVLWGQDHIDESMLIG